MSLLEEINGEKGRTERLSVLVPLPAGQKTFDYLCPEALSPSCGSYVSVPFGKKTLVGVVWNAQADLKVASSRLKPIHAVHDEIPPMPVAHMEFIEWVASYTMSNLGSVLKLALSVPAVFTPLKRKPRAKPENQTTVFDPAAIKKIDLTEHQQQACDSLAQRAQSDEFSVALLDGVTGAGKTEVYFKAIESALLRGKNVLVLLPEIALTTQLIKRFEAHFGFSPTLWHSSLTPAQRRNNWQKIAQGDARVVIGARSALFIPNPNLGVIILDEEHDNAFKQEEGVIYHARDMAIARAMIEKLAVILVSATPTLETYINATSGKYQHLVLPSRFGVATMPDIHLIDMRQQKLPRNSWLSEPLKQAMCEGLERGEQSLLFLNRRGYAPLTLCRTCGHRLKCPNCTAWLVEHRQSHSLRCHHCGYGMRMPDMCPACNDTDTLAACGPGVERIADEVRNLFKDARLALFSSDVMTEPQKLNETIEQIHAGHVDIIIGTQMIAKGHHFPMLTCVGVVDADLGLEGGDLRASEYTFQLLHQVSGRAGRAEHKGQVFLQTYMPDNKVIQAMSRGDRDGFFAAELAEREMAFMPPYSRLAGIIISGPDLEQVADTARALSVTAPRTDKLMTFGPAPAPLAQLRGKFRYRFLVRAPKNINIQKTLSQWLASHSIPSKVTVKVDIDPVSFL